jgi:hypothetical protein
MWQNSLIIVHYSRENGEVYGRLGRFGTAGNLPLLCVRNQLITTLY